MKIRKNLDQLVAEKVMGWELIDYDSGLPTDSYESAAINDGYAWEGDTLGREAHQFKPSVDIAVAFEVVEKLMDTGKYHFQLSEDDTWLAQFFEPQKQNDGPAWVEDIEYQGYGETVPEAICRAALKTLGVSE